MISIIICTYNRDKYIYRTLELLAAECIVAEGCETEILLIDNNSTDTTSDLCRKFEAEYVGKVTYHYILEEKQGLSNARNRGISEAKGDWLVFLDDDAFVQEGYIRHLASGIEHHPEMAAFGGHIEPLYEAGKEPEWMSSWSRSWVSALDMGNEVRRFCGSQYPIGANMGVRTDVARALGGFNPNLGRSGKNTMGGEEKDFFFRLHGDILYLPDVRVTHVIPESRTTREFIARLGDGVGLSERARTLKISRWSYCKRLLSELIKWCGTLVLWMRFSLIRQQQKGAVLVLFRCHVTGRLLAG